MELFYGVTKSLLSILWGLMKSTRHSNVSVDFYCCLSAGLPVLAGFFHLQRLQTKGLQVYCCHN